MKSLEAFELTELVGELVQEDETSFTSIEVYVPRHRFEELDSDVPVHESSCTNPSCGCRLWIKQRVDEAAMVRVRFVTKEPPA